jgi:hypothetical protein
MERQEQISFTFPFIYLVYMELKLGAGCWWRSGWGTALQTGGSRERFLMVSLEFFIDKILPGAL